MPKLALFITLLAFASCSRSGQGTPGEPAAISPETSFGTVLIDVLEAGHPEHYWQYEVQPTTGTVRMVKETSFADYAHEDIPRTFQEPAGAIGACAGTPKIKAPSPDGLYSAHCENAGALEVSLASVGSPVAEWKPKERGIRGFAWSPNSHSVAILNVSSYDGKNPLELIAAFSGHPVPHDKVLLDIVDVRTGVATEYLIRNNVISSFTRILNWSK